MDNIKVPEYTPEMYEKFLDWVRENEPEAYAIMQNYQMGILRNIHRAGFIEGMQHIITHVLMGGDAELIWGKQH